MSVIDFEQWAVGDLILPFGGRTYSVRPPTVEEAKQVLAAAALAELKFGLVSGPLPDGVAEVLASIGDAHPALGQAVYAELVEHGVPDATIARMSVYATFYWARGRQYADTVGKLLWAPREGDTEAGEGEAPKAP